MALYSLFYKSTIQAEHIRFPNLFVEVTSSIDFTTWNITLVYMFISQHCKQNLNSIKSFLHFTEPYKSTLLKQMTKSGIAVKIFQPVSKTSQIL